jgi:glucose dehydrogenase
VVSKMSTRTGLAYTYTLKKDPVSGVDVWYWSALDFRTGRVVWEKRAGTGALFNNQYAGLAIGPDRNAYLGVLGGIAAIKDTRGHCCKSRRR